MVYFLLMVILLPSLLFAKSLVYVSDQVEIPIRDSIGQSGNIIKRVLSGEQLELLQSVDSGWTKVKTAQGEVGWIISRYLMNTAAAREKLPILQSQYDTKRIEYNQLKMYVDTLEKRLAKLQNKYQQLLVEKSKLDAKVEHIEKTYQNALQIEHENQQLNSKILQQNTQIQLLKQSNIYEQDRNARNWFIVGALVLFFGVVIGVSIVIFFYKKQAKKYL